MDSPTLRRMAAEQLIVEIALERAHRDKATRMRRAVDAYRNAVLAEERATKAETRDKR